VSNFSQRLLDDFVVVEMAEPEQATIKLPNWKRTLRGKVVAVGPGKLLYSGERAPTAAALGDTVVFAATAGMDSSYGIHTNVRLMRDQDVDAVLA
jgi:chaperonin GroES